MEVDCKNTVYLSLLLAISHRAVVVLVVLLKSTKRPASNQQVSQCNKKFLIFSRRLAACLFCQCHLHGCLAIANAKGRYGRVRNEASREKTSSRACRAHVSSHSPLGESVWPHISRETLWSPEETHQYQLGCADQMDLNC